MKMVFDRYYKHYDAWYTANKWAYLSELKAVKKLLPQTGRGLEIGVGTGRFAEPLGIDIGIDISRQMLRMAKDRGVDARLDNGENLSFEASCFDYVAIIVTICFTKSPERVLAETERVLKSHGQVIIGMIDKESFLGKFYQTEKKSIFYKYATFFSVTQITELLIATGFNQFSYCNTLFELPNAMISIHSPVEGYGQGGFVVIRAYKIK